MARASEKQLLPLLGILAVVGMWLVILIVLSVDEPTTLLGATTTLPGLGYTPNTELVYGYTVLTAVRSTDGTISVTVNNPSGDSAPPSGHSFVNETAYYSVDGVWTPFLLTADPSVDQSDTPLGWIMGRADNASVLVNSPDDVHIAVFTCREYNTSDFGNSNLPANDWQGIATQLYTDFGDTNYGYRCGIKSFTPSGSGYTVDDDNWRLLTLPSICTPSSEVCDGQDNDCDGTADNGLTPPSRACSAGTGACQASGTEYKTCGGTSGWSSSYSGCTATPSSPSSEVCDGADNDCNGQTDENPDSLCSGTSTCVSGSCQSTSCDPTNLCSGLGSYCKFFTGQYGGPASNVITCTLQNGEYCPSSTLCNQWGMNEYPKCFDGGSPVCVTEPLVLTTDKSAYVAGETINSTVTYYNVTTLDGCAAVIMMDGTPGDDCFNDPSAVWKTYTELIAQGDWTLTTAGDYTEMVGATSTDLTNSFTIKTSFRDSSTGLTANATFTIN